MSSLELMQGLRGNLNLALSIESTIITSVQRPVRPEHLPGQGAGRPIHASVAILSRKVTRVFVLLPHLSTPVVFQLFDEEAVLDASSALRVL